ncbi:siroheme synthase [Thermaurantiacus sp.]
MKGLPLFHIVAGKPVVVVGTGPAAEAKRRLVAEAGGIPVDALVAGARLAFVARDDAPEAEAARLRAAGLLVNVVDRPDLSDFTVPAIVDRTPVTVAIATAGRSASLAKALKERLEILLPPGLAALAEAIHAARAAVAARHAAPSARRAFWARLLSPGAPLDPLAPPTDPAAAIAAALAAGPPPDTGGLATLVVPEGGAEALTLADLRRLAASDLLVLDGPVPPEVLALARRDAARIVGPAPPPGAAGRILILRAS